MNKKQYESQRQIKQVLVNFENTRCMNQIESTNFMLEFWIVDGMIIIFQLWDIGGWEYYIQGNEGKVDKIADAIKKQLNKA